MELIKHKKLLFTFAIFLLTIKLSISIIYEQNPEDNLFDEYYGKTTTKRRMSSKNNDYGTFEKMFPKKPTSTFDFLYQSFLNRLNAYFYSFNDYFDGFYFILSKYKYLFRRYSSNKIINETYTNKPKYEKYFNKEESKNKKYSRRLSEKKMGQTNNDNFNKSKKIKIRESYEYNNTDLYNMTTCPTSPDLKVYYYYYFCDGIKVSKSTYEEKISKGEKCEFYNNTQKLCFCPIHYSSCQLKSESRIRCMAKEIIVNNNINLTKYYDTFYEEYFKTPILDYFEKIFNFSIKLKCGMPISDSVTGSDINFYLSNANDENAEFDIISTMDNDTEYKKQYTKEEVMNNKTHILDYYLKKKNLVMYQKPKLNLTFSIIDQQWVIPYRIKSFEIKDDLVEDLLSGEKSFNFTIDILDLIDNGVGVGPFSSKNLSYPYFDKGDMHFFEIDFKEEEKQMRFYAYRGEIKK